MTRRAFPLLSFTLACAGTDHAGTIELTKSVLIAGVGDSVDLSARCARVSDHGWVAARRVEPPSDVIAMYDSTGTYRYSVGRAGGGPGEFSSILSFGFGPGDSLWVFEFATAQVFEPAPGARFIRSFPLSRAFGGEPTPHGILVPPMYGRSYEYPRLLSWTGEEIRRFPVPDTGSRELTQAGPVTLSGSDRLWMALERKYEMILLDSDGAVQRRVARQAEWFPAYAQPSGFPWINRPNSWIHSITVGPDSLLWGARAARASELGREQGEDGPRSRDFRRRKA